MVLLTALRDFAGGLSRGFGLYFSERNDYVERTMKPVARPAKRR